MKTCIYCNREITIGKKIINNGVQYICSNEEDVKICNEIKEAREESKRNAIFNANKIYIKQIGGEHVSCRCGNSFYTNFPIETSPPCGICPYCGASHYSK